MKILFKTQLNIGIKVWGTMKVEACKRNMNNNHLTICGNNRSSP